MRSPYYKHGRILVHIMDAVPSRTGRHLSDYWSLSRISVPKSAKSKTRSRYLGTAADTTSTNCPSQQHTPTTPTSAASIPATQSTRRPMKGTKARLIYSASKLDFKETVELVKRSASTGGIDLEIVDADRVTSDDEKRFLDDIRVIPPQIRGQVKSGGGRTLPISGTTQLNRSGPSEIVPALLDCHLLASPVPGDLRERTRQEVSDRCIRVWKRACRAERKLLVRRTKC